MPAKHLVSSFVILLCLDGRSTAADGPMTSDDLSRLYRIALQEQFSEPQLPRLQSAHALIERFFAAADDPQRQQVLRELERMQIDPHLLARIIHIRLHWQDLQPGVYYINESFNGYAVHYFLGIPAGYNRTRPWPLVIRLPGAHAFLTDPRPTQQQVVEFYTAWITRELTRRPDALILMPLLNLDEFYGPSTPGMNSVIQPMLHAFDRVHIDPTQVYLIGHGMSAHAVWNIALHYPTYFAAIMPLAGSASGDWQRVRLLNLRNLLPVVWHDADDLTIPVRSSQRLVQGMRNQDLDVHYEETRGIGHAPSQPLIERLDEIMRNRRRRLHPRQVAIQSNRPDAMFNRVDWLQVDDPAQPGPQQRLRLAHGSGFIIVHRQPWRAEATLNDDNTIDITTRNVQRLRIFLNDRMIDFDRPVTVTINGRPRFEGIVQPSIETLLQDQLFLGRGWRAFPAMIEIEW